ncbi:MAG: hypothetical protein WKG07_23555 [Hymenobacter sp.]
MRPGQRCWPYPRFRPAPADTAPTPAPADDAPLKTLREQERDHILAALHRTGGRVSGAQGAATTARHQP